MNEPTLFLYTWITGDERRRERFYQRWQAGGVAAARTFCIRLLVESIHGDDEPAKTQRRLIQCALSRASYLELGYRVATFVQKGIAAVGHSDP